MFSVSCIFPRSRLYLNHSPAQYLSNSFHFFIFVRFRKGLGPSNFYKWLLTPHFYDHHGCNLKLYIIFYTFPFCFSYSPLPLLSFLYHTTSSNLPSQDVYKILTSKNQTRFHTSTGRKIIASDKPQVRNPYCSLISGHILCSHLI